MMKRTLFKHLLVLWLTIATTSAFAAGEGTAIGVDPDAVAQINSVDRILTVGADVSVGEVISTGPAGLVQIVFDDDTRLVVGPRSRLLIENYLLASSNTAQKLTINALGGSFRFITGNSPKPAYSIKTPTAAIAVRGTEFDILVESGGTQVMLYDGALQICNAGGGCEDLTRLCQVATVGRSETALYERDDARRIPLSLLFRYARFQAKLLGDFRISGAALCAEGQPVAIPEEESDSDSDSTTPPVTQIPHTSPTEPTTPTAPTAPPTRP